MARTTFAVAKSTLPTTAIRSRRGAATAISARLSAGSASVREIRTAITPARGWTSGGNVKRSYPGRYAGRSPGFAAGLGRGDAHGLRRHRAHGTVDHELEVRLDRLGGVVSQRDEDLHESGVGGAALGGDPLDAGVRGVGAAGHVVGERLARAHRFRREVLDPSVGPEFERRALGGRGTLRLRVHDRRERPREGQGVGDAARAIGLLDAVDRAHQVAA
ncbi:MAG: hypothetical protein ACKOTD_12290 [Phycisphaerales bacterium]